jgi:hypothetical protein
MSIASKFPGGGRVSGSSEGYQAGTAASMGIRKFGGLVGNSRQTGNARVAISDATHPGDNHGTRSISSSNDIGKFTSGVSEHHPYKERGGAFDQTKSDWQATPSARSSFRTPSGGTHVRDTGKVNRTQGPKPYDDIKRENPMPANATSMKSPGGPKGGVQGMMNRMKSGRK